jgi:hypothetical protein
VELADPVSYLKIFALFTLDSFSTSQIINKFVCAFNSSAEHETEAVELEKGGQVTPETASSRYQVDWYNAFLALHSVLVLFYSVIFILGYLIIR